jgi:hypothetical protein
MYLPYGFDACSRESVPFDCYISASLSCLWFVQGSLFPLISVQQACLAYVLFKGLCTLFLVLLVPSVFLIYNILTFDKKKRANHFYGHLWRAINVPPLFDSTDSKL